MSAANKRRPLLVMKFGGTSVASAERMQGVAEIVADWAKSASIVVVTSAMAGITDSLLQTARAASRGLDSAWKERWQELCQTHRTVAQDLLPAVERERILPLLEREFGQLETRCSGFAMVREVTPRALDAVSSAGEVLAAMLLAAALRVRGVSAEAVDAASLIVSNDSFGRATPLLRETAEQSREQLQPLLECGKVPVVTGFRASTRAGVLTTLGRGGSDHSATILGAALEASEVWIWTDVDGVMTADPRLVPRSHLLPEVTYREALELCFFGARVLQPQAIGPLMKKKIPLWIKNTLNPVGAGTRVCESVANSRAGVRAITSVSEACLLTVNGKDALKFPQLAARVFTGLELENVTTLIVTQSSAENVLSFAVHDADKARTRERLERIFELELLHGYMEPIEILSEIGVVVAVGEKMKGTPGIAGRLFGALGRRGINVITIAQGSSELSISFAVRSSDVTEAVRATHAEFQPERVGVDAVS